MELNFTQELNLNKNQIVLLEMHSVLNIANILLEELSSLHHWCGKIIDIAPLAKDLQELKDHLSDRARTFVWIVSFNDFKNRCETLIKKMYSLNPDLKNDQELSGTVKNIRSVLDIFETRVRELLARKDDPYVWIDHETFALKQNFNDVLTAFVVNARDQFQIVTDEDKKTRPDYLIDFKIVSIIGYNIIHMPAALQDTIRDLVANARKYTPPGGKIKAVLSDEGREIHFHIEDNGMGIPENELSHVVDFGYRASNTKDKRQFGGGFGLTKAYYLTKRMNGTFKITSAPGAGTIIDLVIPRS